MRCTDFNLGKMIGRYEYDLLSPAEKQLFEAHLLACDACFSDLYSTSQLVENVRRHAKEIQSVLNTTKSQNTRFLAPVIKLWQSLAASGEKILAPIPVGIRVAAGSIVVTVALLLFILPSRKNYNDLVHLAPAAYKEFTLRNQVAAEQQLFSEAMTFYQKKDYTAAIPKLRQVHEEYPKLLAASFYLGVCLLLENQPRAAIPYLQTVAQRGDAYYQEASNWYLANAFLLLGEVQQSRARLELVLQQTGSHYDQAEKLLSALK